LNISLVLEVVIGNGVVLKLFNLHSSVGKKIHSSCIHRICWVRCMSILCTLQEVPSESSNYDRWQFWYNYFTWVTNKMQF